MGTAQRSMVLEKGAEAIEHGVIVIEADRFGVASYVQAAAGA